MNNNPKVMESLRDEYDKSGMLRLAESIPMHMRDAWIRAADFEDSLPPDITGDISRIVVCGMGGSAIGADLAAAVAGSRLGLPLHVVRNYEVSVPVANGSLGIISSYSGNTAETLSAYETMKKESRAMLAITTGGTLGEKCKSEGIPLCLIPGGMPPRAAIAYSLVPILRILRAMGFLQMKEEEFSEGVKTAEKLCEGYSLPAGGGNALDLAEKLHGKLPFVYADMGLLAPVARRWACQFNENSKVLAHFAMFPELCHNEIVGWEKLVSVMPQSAVLSLEDSEDHPVSVKQRIAAVDLIKGFGEHIESFETQGRGRLSRLLSVMLLGDFASIYLALLNGVDPTPVEKISLLKKRMSETD